MPNPGNVAKGNVKRDNPQADRTPETQSTGAKVVELRRARMSWTDIAKTLNISSTWARALYQRILAEIPAQQVDEHRAEELILYDDAVADLLTIAKSEQVTHRSRIEAWSTIRAWSERKAKLLGLDAPTQVVSIDKIDAEIAQLTRELESLANAGEDVPAE